MEAVTCLRSRVLASAGSFPPCSPEDRCTCIRPVRSRCRWHYLHRAWTSTGEYLLWNKKKKKKKVGFQLLYILPPPPFMFLGLFSPPASISKLSLSCSHHSILSPRGKLRTPLAQASSSSAPAEEKRRVFSHGGQQEKHKYVLFDEIQQVVSKTG